MPILVSCPTCGATAEISRAAVGCVVRCRGCAADFDVPRGSGELKVEWGPSDVGRRIALRPPHGLTIGRADGNALMLQGPAVSRQHAAIVWENDEWLLLDLASGNGTTLNGSRVEEHALANGDVLIVGDFALRAFIVS